MSSAAQVAFRKWLREQLVGLVGVQRCVFGQTALAGDPTRVPDLLIYMWAGVVIHVHVIDEPIKPGKVRRIIEEATNGGTPVLFIIQTLLLPPPGGRADIDQWFVPLGSLVNDRLYVYQFANGMPQLITAQFKPITRRDVAVSYGPPITIKQIRHYRTNVKHNALKGFWLLADLEGDASANASFYRRADYGAFNQPYTPPRRDFPPPGSKENTGTPPPPAQNGKPRLEDYYAMLGVKPTATREEVKAAFRKLAFEVHPDVSNLPKPEAEARFKRLTEAYEFIKMVNDW